MWHTLALCKETMACRHTWSLFQGRRSSHPTQTQPIGCLLLQALAWLRQPWNHKRTLNSAWWLSCRLVCVCSVFSSWGCSDVVQPCFSWNKEGAARVPAKVAADEAVEEASRKAPGATALSFDRVYERSLWQQLPIVIRRQVLGAWRNTPLNRTCNANAATTSGGWMRVFSTHVRAACLSSCC